MGVRVVGLGWVGLVSGGWRVVMGSVKFSKRIKAKSAVGECFSISWVECKKGQERWPPCLSCGGVFGSEGVYLNRKRDPSPAWLDVIAVAFSMIFDDFHGAII